MKLAWIALLLCLVSGCAAQRQSLKVTIVPQKHTSVTITWETEL